MDQENREGNEGGAQEASRDERASEAAPQTASSDPREEASCDDDEPVGGSERGRSDLGHDEVESVHEEGSEGPTPPSSQTYLHNLAFNQDCTCFALATSEDFRSFTLSPLAEVSRRRPGGVNVAAMLFQTNYLAIVTKAAPYKVQLWDDHLGVTTCELWSRFEVLNVVLRRDVVVVVSEYKIYVYEFGNSFPVLLFLETCSNPRGVCALCPAGADWVLAAPSSVRGSIRIQRGLDDSVSCTVEAHSNSIAALGTNSSGTLVASASEVGTVIKIFSSIDGSLLFEFRRGSTSTQISSLAFRADSLFLAVGSANQTVHVFRLNDGSGSYAAKLAGRIAEWTGGSPQLSESPLTDSGHSSRSNSLLPKSLPKYFQSSRAFALFKISDAGDLRLKGSVISGPLACFSKTHPNHLFIVHSNGLLYEVTFDEQRVEYGQDCALVGASAFFQARPEFTVGAPVEIDDVWEVI